MSKIKKGDTVVRIAGWQEEMAVGDRGTVESVSGSVIRLKEFDGEHDETNLVKFDAEASPIFSRGFLRALELCCRDGYGKDAVEAAIETYLAGLEAGRQPRTRGRATR